MKSDTRTVSDLFGLAVRYVVPLYQRPYVWNEEKQWESLWADMVVLLEHQLTNSAPTGTHFSHFLGAIVVEQESQVPGRIPLFTVIDGQQRLTTLQILLSAASDTALSADCEDDAGILRDLVVNDRRKAQGDELFKVWPTNVNRDAFKAVLQPGGPPADREDDPENLIDEAYAYFAARLAEWVNEDTDAAGVSDRVHALQVALCDRLKVVSITLEHDDNAQIIFETLNARGTPLLAIDLVKNAVFHEATRQDLDVDQLYHDVWRPQLDDVYWRRKRRQGRLFRAQGELFLMHWLGMKLRRVIPATELFATFRKDILQGELTPDMCQLIPELCRDARILRSFDDQPENSIEALFFERLEDLDVTILMPLVLFFFRDAALPVERRRRALRILESWLVRRSLLRLTSKNYNNFVPALLTAIAKDPEHADDVLCRQLRAGESALNMWPSDKDFVDYLTTHDAYGNIAQRRLVMALSAVERFLCTDKVDVVGLPRSLSLEHIMPQSWRQNWRLPADLTPEEHATATVERQARIHRLGNLTLTTLRLNQDMSNKPWLEKREELNKGSKLLLNTELMARYSDVFDDSAIDQRTRLMAHRLCLIWPGPDAWD